MSNKNRTFCIDMSIIIWYINNTKTETHDRYGETEQKQKPLTIKYFKGEVNFMTITTFDSVSHFIHSYSLPKGVAEGVLRTMEDCEDFYIGFYGKNHYVADDLLDYRENKLEKANITLDIYLEMCYTKGMKETFENVFLQSFTDLEIRRVAIAIAKKKTSLEQLFAGFQKNPNKNILKNIV